MKWIITRAECLVQSLEIGYDNKNYMFIIKMKRKRGDDGTLKILPVPVPSMAHPPPPNHVLPKHEFTMGLIAPKGAGKTTTMCNLLHFYRNFFHTIIIISPTIHSDEKWDWVKKQKLLVENIPLIQWIKKEEQKRLYQHGTEIVQKPPQGSQFANAERKKEAFTGLIPEKSFYTEYNEDSLRDLMEEQMSLIKALKAAGQTKFLANRILLICDDLVGSALFSNRKDNYFKGFNTRHRHYSTSCLMVSQGYKEIPKTIRTNWTCLLVYEIANDKEIEVIYEENTMGLKRDDWIEMYEYATREEFSFLFMDAKKPKNLRCMINFEKVLLIGD